MFLDANQGRFPRSSHSALAYREPAWGRRIAIYLDPTYTAQPGPLPVGFAGGVYRCPEDDRDDPLVWHYGKNVWFELSAGETGDLVGELSGPTYPRLASIPSTSRTVLVGELLSGSGADHMMAHFWRIGGEVEVDVDRHRGVSNFLWVDGHVSPESFTDTFDWDKQLDRWDPGFAAGQ